jgi:hypothetical protein
MNTIKYKDLNNWYLSDERKKLAKEVFGNKQPNIFRTGFYSAPSWNWGYEIGIVGVNEIDYNGLQEETTKYYEVVTQFGEVVGAIEINLPTLTK